MLVGEAHLKASYSGPTGQVSPTVAGSERLLCPNPSPAALLGTLGLGIARSVSGTGMKSHSRQ